RVIRRERGFEQDARVARLALQRPVLLRQRQRPRPLPEEVEIEPRLLLLVQLVTAHSRRIEAGPVLEQCHNLLWAPAIEQEIGVSSEQELVAHAERERLLEVSFRAVG